MAKYPSEIFGYYYIDRSLMAKKARIEYQCPFVEGKCVKKSRMIDFPFGVCPRRFLEKEIVFHQIAKHYFDSLNNLLVFSEVGVSGIGSFDYVIVKHKPLSTDIEDFVIIELQTGQTASTGALVKGFKDFLKNPNCFEKVSYPFGINSYDIWKRTFTQILNKGVILEKWKKKIFWVVQNSVFDYFQNKYRLPELGYQDNHSIIFSLYDLKRKGDSLRLQPARLLSSCVDELFESFRKNDNIPDIDTFLKKLEKRMHGEAKMGLRLDSK